MSARYFYAITAVAVIAAGFLPWALGFGRRAPQQVPAIAATSNSSSNNNNNNNPWSPTPHAASMAHLGGQPALITECGAERDLASNPKGWSVIDGDDPCLDNWGHSVIMTSRSDPHSATYQFTQFNGITDKDGGYTVEAWIPAKTPFKDVQTNTFVKHPTFATAEYLVQYCGSDVTSNTWTQFGTINQETASGWTPVSGTLSLSESQPVCAIRVESTGSGAGYLAEDAIEILSS